MTNDHKDCIENKVHVIDIEARVENLPQILEFIDVLLEEAGCPLRIRYEIDVAAEEIFVNIASYAYKPNVGMATVMAALSDDPASITITFKDKGRQYDPLARKDPDTTLSAKERPIGGLGVYIVKTTMDDAFYNYEDGFNVLTIKKNF